MCQPNVDNWQERAAELLRRRKDGLLSAWRSSIAGAIRRRRPESDVQADVPGEEIEAFVGMVLKRLEGRASDDEFSTLTHWLFDSDHYGMSLRDVTEAMLSFKSVARELIFEEISEELQAFRVAAVVEGVVEGLVRKAAELYELTSEAELRTVQQHSEDILAAWEADGGLTRLAGPDEVLEQAASRLRQIFGTANCTVRLFENTGEPKKDLTIGKEIPVPLVKENTQFLTGPQRERGGIIDIYERSRRRREPCTVADLNAAEIVNSVELLDAGVRSLACYPLHSADRVVGALLLHSGKPGAFQEHQNRAMLDFARVLGAAFERTAWTQRSARQMSEEEVAARIGRSVLELATEEQLLKAVVQALQEFRDYLEVSLFRVDEQRGQCALVAEAGRHAPFLPEDYTQALGNGYVGLCAQNGETLLATDLEDDPRRYIAFEEEHLGKSELCVPVKKGPKVIGVLHLESERPDAFPESDTAALEKLSTHIAVALENARMREEQRHSEYELEQAHRQITNITRSTAIGITSTDPSGLYMHWNPSCEKMLGYKSEEVVGKLRPSDIIAEPFDLQESLRTCLQEGQTSAERRFLKRDGTIRIIDETRVPLRDENGKHMGFTSYLVDVTDRKLAEERLREEHDKLNLVVDAMGAGLALFDGDRRLQWANKALMQWFEFGTDAVGQRCSEIYKCGMNECDSCPMAQAIERGAAGTRIGEMTDSRGVWHCYQLVVSPVDYGDTRLLALTMDITEQRRQTEQMKLINRLIKGVESTLELDKVLHLVLTCVTAGHALGFNRAFLFLLDEHKQYLEGRLAVGPGSHEEASRIWRDLWERGDTLEELLESPERGASDQRLTELICRIRIPFGRRDHVLIRPLVERRAIIVRDASSDGTVGEELIERLSLTEFVCVPLVTREELLGVILADNKYSGVRIDERQVGLLEMFCGQAALTIANARAYRKIRDQMDELNRTQEKLIESERLASIGQMSGHLAHEIRNPLTTIGGFARYIASHMDKDSRIHRNASIIYDECIRLENTLANVLDYTRPIRPRREPVDLNKLIEETTNQFRSIIEENGIHLELALQDGLEQIQADARMIKQVIINLLKNAIEAVEQKSDARISFSTRAQGDRVEITASDSGIGVETEARAKLFSPFFSTKVGGSGLGMSVSQRIVRQHGGEISFESEPGEGTTFYVTLPVNPDGDVESNGD